MSKVRVVTYGPSSGVCNICGADGKLTEDHTPPKGCIRVGAVKIQHIVERLSAPPSDIQGRISQNGIKYRTLCAKCNNAVLGGAYDPSLVEFANAVGSFLDSPIALPKQMHVRTKPQRVMRSILGHLKAQGVDRYDIGPDTIPVRDYIQDPTFSLPDWIRIYHWVYPYSSQVVIRDCGYMDLRIHQQFIIWILKFYPCAFLVTWRQPAEHSFNLNSLSDYRHLGINDEVEFPVSLNRIIHERWPEAPTDHSVLIYGQEAIMANERGSKPLPANSVVP